MTKGSTATLRPICFGARKTRGNEVWLHSHLGDGFSGDYAINKCHQYVFGQPFVRVADCYTIKFILSYEGGNPAILCLQMRLMCWDVNIVHRPDVELMNADYWLQLGADLNFDPLYRNLHVKKDSHTLPPRIYPCIQKICLTTKVHAFRNLLLK